MTLDFWAAVRVGSGIVVFPRDFDRKANLFHKDRAESSGKADVFRFVFFFEADEPWWGSSPADP